MAVKKFVVEERLSQYPALEFEFKGKTYKAAALSVSLINTLNEIEQSETDKKNSPQSLNKMMRTIIPGLTEKLCNEIDIRVVLEFISYVTDFCSNPENVISEELKKKINIGEVRPS